jgi:hypothetical protein
MEPWGSAENYSRWLISPDLIFLQEGVQIIMLFFVSQFIVKFWVQINNQFIVKFLQIHTIAYIWFFWFIILYGWMQLWQYKNKFHLCVLCINKFLHICIIVKIYLKICWQHIQISNYLPDTLIADFMLQKCYYFFSTRYHGPYYINKMVVLH